MRGAGLLFWEGLCGLPWFYLDFAPRIFYNLFIAISLPNKLINNIVSN